MKESVRSQQSALVLVVSVLQRTESQLEDAYATNQLKAFFALVLSVTYLTEIALNNVCGILANSVSRIA